MKNISKGIQKRPFLTNHNETELLKCIIYPYIVLNLNDKICRLHWLK